LPEDPFEVVKDFRAVQLKKRRKLLRFINKENKLKERRRYQFNLKVEERPTDMIHLIRPFNSENDVFNMFFDESANLVQDTNEFRSQIFANDFDFKEDSELFSKTTIMSEKSSLFAQEFIKFEFEGVW
jgi:hypothetical protein